MCIRHNLTKKVLALIGCLLLLCSLVITASATTPTDDTAENTTVALPQPPTLLSDGFIVMNAKTGDILYEKNSNKLYHPASCTKIMTALLTLENGKLLDDVTMSHNAIWGIDRASSHIALDVGEIVSVNDLLHGLLIASGNECAMGLAEYVSDACGGDGTVEDFVNRMNERAKELGAKNTNFVNPHGLYNEAHVSTPYDLAQIMRQCIQNQTFISISATTHYTVYTNYMPSGRPFSHSNRLLTNSEYHYSDVICGKTGYTKDSGGSLVSYASRNGMELITVTMGTESLKNSFLDTTALLDFCFDNHTAVVTSSADVFTDTITLNDGVTANVYSNPPENLILPNGVALSDLTVKTTAYDSLTLPLKADVPVGTAQWYYLDKELAGTPLYTSNAVSAPLAKKKNKTLSPLLLFFNILLTIVLVLLGIVVLFIIAAFINRRVRRARRRRKRVHQNENIFR